jgi:LysM repeat protein
MQISRDATLRARRERVDLGTVAGVTLENDRDRFAFASNDAAGVDSVLADVTRGVRSDAASVELAKRTREYEQDVSAKAVWHVVAAGDALSSIAARYGTTEAELTALNQLSSTTIKTGRRLLIKPGK